MKKTGIFISLILSTCLALIGPSFAYAQETALAISPSEIKLLVKPARTMIFEYSVKNSGDPTVIRLQMKPVEPDSDTGILTIRPKPDDAIKFSLEDKRYQFDNPIIMKTGQTLKISVEAQIPETVTGDHYYSFIVQSDPPPIVEGSAVTRARLAVGSVLLLSVAEKYPADAKVSVGSFRIHPARPSSFMGNDRDLVDSFEKSYPILTLSNASLHFIQAEGTIEFSGFGGKQKFTLPRFTILAQSSRRLYELENNTEYSPRLLIGNYTVTARLKIIESGQIITQSTQIFVFPLKLFFLIMLLIAGGGIIILRRHIRKNKKPVETDKS